MNPKQMAAVRAIASLTGQRDWSVGRLAREAGVDPGTVGDFLLGNRWPRLTTRAKIEKALGLRVGDIQRMADGTLSPETVVPAPKNPDPTSDLPVGSGIDPELLTELAQADPAAIDAVRAVLRAARRGD